MSSYLNTYTIKLSCCEYVKMQFTCILRAVSAYNDENLSWYVIYLVNYLRRKCCEQIQNMQI